MDPRKIGVIQHWPQATTVKQLLKLLGMANYCRQCAQKFSTISAFLDAIRKTKGRIELNQEMLDAFRKVKERMAKHTILMNPDDEKMFVVGTDASTCGLGA